MCLVTTFLVIPAMTVGSIHAAEIDQNLMIFKDLIGKQWEGHFEDAEESITLYMSWQPITGGAAVEMSGWSSISDMTRRNIYYFDRTKNQVAFLAMTSNGYVATGKVHLEDSVLIFLGLQVWPDGSVHDTKSRWQFLPDASIRVIGYSFENNEWKPGHKILYTASDSK